MKDFLEFAVSTAIEAGEILMRNYGRILSKDWNQRAHFKTEVDDMSDKLIGSRIRESFPEHNIWSEEGKHVERSSDFTWIFDALDGTIPYTFGTTDHFSVSIGLARGKKPIVGAIYAPRRDELYTAEEGLGAFCNRQRIRVSLEENLGHSIIGFDSGKESEGFDRGSFGKYYKRLLSPNGIMCPLCSGAAAVPLCLNASGKMNGYFALSLEPWDMAAAVVINREAGAKVTNIEGKEWDIYKHSVLTANPKLHEKLFGLLKD